jgi:cell wall-associated NlpC family hydrolase
MINVTPFIGVQFREKGRTLAGCDCYGLVKLIYKFKHGFDPLPDFSDDYENTGDYKGIGKCIDNEQKNWKEVHEPQEGAIIIFSIQGKPHHVGVCTGFNKGEAWFLHVHEGVNSKHERLKSTLWNQRIDSMYVYE